MNHVSVWLSVCAWNVWTMWRDSAPARLILKLWSPLQQMSPGLLTKKYSSCSTIFIDDSTVSQPNLKSTIKWWVTSPPSSAHLHWTGWLPALSITSVGKSSATTAVMASVGTAVGVGRRADADATFCRTSCLLQKNEITSSASLFVCLSVPASLWPYTIT